jgi:predicted acylesterase/phospholipase RssA
MGIKEVAFSAAGFSGFIHLGVLEVLQTSGALDETTRFVGTSAGSIIATLAALGVPAKDVSRSIIERRMDFEKVLDVSIIRFLESLGLSDGKRLFEEVEFYVNMGWRPGEERTFASLSARGVQLRLFGTSLDKGNVLVFDSIHTPDMLVMDAIRISCSLPFLLPFCKHHGEICVDGAIFKYFPIEELSDLGDDEKLGVCILCTNQNVGQKPSLYGYICMLLATILRLRADCGDMVHTLCIKSDPKRALPDAKEIAEMVTTGRELMSAFWERRAKTKVD